MILRNKTLINFDKFKITYFKKNNKNLQLNNFNYIYEFTKFLSCLINNK